MDTPHLIIISGPPAAGKSTSARPLADALGYPLLCMDDVKEHLADAIGPEASAIAESLGDAAVKHILIAASEFLDRGLDVIVEGFFQSDRYSEDFAKLTTKGDAILIHLFAEDAELKRRYENRATHSNRHWIHGDVEKLGTLKPELPEYMARRLHLDIPQIVVDTTHQPVNINATLQLIHQEQQLRIPEKSA